MNEFDYAERLIEHGKKNCWFSSTHVVNGKEVTAKQYGFWVQRMMCGDLRTTLVPCKTQKEFRMAIMEELKGLLK